VECFQARDGQTKHWKKGYLVTRQDSYPLVSTVIPTHNDGEMVAEAIESALGQTYPHLEIIVVNDGSSDHTPEVLARYADNNRVRVFHQKNAGVSAARNTALRSVRGEYVAFLDADDLWLPQKTEIQMSLFRKNPDLGLVYSRRRAKILNQQGQWIDDDQRNQLYATKHYDRGHVFRQMVAGGGVGLSSAIVPTHVLNEVGGFDEELHTSEDRHLYARIAHKYPFDFVEDALVIKRRHRSNLSWDTSREPQTLDFLRKLADEFPEYSLKNSKWMRHTYVYWAFLTGQEALNEGRLSQARRDFWQACKYAPWVPIRWAYLIASLMPRPVRNVIRGFKRWTRGKRFPQMER
jgi:glycosyltransferase involved in cell wall biosynthesis